MHKLNRTAASTVTDLLPMQLTAIYIKQTRKRMYTGIEPPRSPAMLSMMVQSTRATWSMRAAGCRPIISGAGATSAAAGMNSAPIFIFLRKKVFSFGCWIGIWERWGRIEEDSLNRSTFSPFLSSTDLLCYLLAAEHTMPSASVVKPSI